MTDVTIQDTTPVNVTTSLVSGQLVLSVDGTAIGTVTDEFHAPSSPPSNMTLFVANLPSGAQVSAQWKPSSGGTWTQFTRATGGVQAQFPMPSAGSQASYDFQAEVTEHGVIRDDPKLVLKVITRTEDRRL
jgi:hypothetical protein